MEQQAMRPVEPFAQNMRRKTAPPILKQAADITRADPAAPCHPLDVQLWIAQAAGDLGLDRLEPRRLHAGLLGQRRTVDVRRGDGGDQVADMPGGARPRRARDRFGAPAPHETGRAACRERVWQYGYVSVVAVLIKKK